MAPECRKKKSEDATFLADLRDHFDEFIHASMDEHKECFKKTMKKLFGMSKAVAEKNSESTGIESVLPLQTIDEQAFSVSELDTMRKLVKIFTGKKTLDIHSPTVVAGMTNSLVCV
ncbi:hypothetical protein EJ110_NYTH08598 [Nymphaea thermarum]|nr:hypothetical protein EJ110_NYTH08598 [Nymphaea thermarum]